MPFTVEPVRSAKPAIKKLRGAILDRYNKAVERLEHQGCKAGGHRMRAEGGGDARVCSVNFYADWRMHLLFDDEDVIWVSFVGRHQRKKNIHSAAAEAIPELSKVGRPPADRPKCCDELDDTPVAEDLVDLVRRL